MGCRARGVGGVGCRRCACERQAKKVGEQGQVKAKGGGPGPRGEREPKRRGPHLQPMEVPRRGVEPQPLPKQSCRATMSHT